MKVFVVGRDIVGVFATRERAGHVALQPSSGMQLQEMELLGFEEVQEDARPHHNLKLPVNVNMLSGKELDDYARLVRAPPRNAGEADQTYRHCVSLAQRLDDQRVF